MRIGNLVSVAGTASIGDDGKTVGIGDVEAQTRRCFFLIERALNQLDASLDNVIRTRIMLTDINEWKGAAKVHGEIFGAIRPASTFVEVKGLINPEWIVEIEADAVL